MRSPKNFSEIRDSQKSQGPQGFDGGFTVEQSRLAVLVEQAKLARGRRDRRRRIPPNTALIAEAAQAAIARREARAQAEAEFRAQTEAEFNHRRRLEQK
jgi:hypothetical protein